jgi:hypothetical protein
MFCQIFAYDARGVTNPWRTVHMMFRVYFVTGFNSFSQRRLYRLLSQAERFSLTSRKL